VARETKSDESKCRRTRSEDTKSHDAKSTGTKLTGTKPETFVSFTLREFLPKDLKELSEIDQQCFPPGIAYDRRELASYIQRGDALTLVAEAAPCRPENYGITGSARIVGFIVVHKLKRGIGHVITIDVLPQAQRTGLGSQLMAQAEGKLQAAGCHSMYLEVAVNNLAAIQFYKRHGYFVLKTIPRYYQGELDALLMIKRLA
jgi:ribosomal-protein-alanine N-acetyltransferase